MVSCLLARDVADTKWSLGRRVAGWALRRVFRTSVSALHLRGARPDAQSTVTNARSTSCKPCGRVSGRTDLDTGRRDEPRDKAGTSRPCRVPDRAASWRPGACRSRPRPRPQCDTCAASTYVTGLVRKGSCARSDRLERVDQGREPPGEEDDLLQQPVLHRRAGQPGDVRDAGRRPVEDDEDGEQRGAERVEPPDVGLVADQREEQGQRVLDPESARLRVRLKKQRRTKRTSVLQSDRHVSGSSRDEGEAGPP